MHKELFRFNLPVFLSNLFDSNQLTVYSYAFCIVFGTLIGAVYTWRCVKNELKTDLSNSFFYLVFIAGFVGGKLFFYLEKPLFYFSNPSIILHNFSGGFVFYGSFVTCIPTVIWYLQKNKIAVLPLLDILAITTLIVHSFGRLGCFLAGCCLGTPTNSAFGIIFPSSNQTAVHPTQLYEAIVLLALLIFLQILKNKKQFHGQVFILYLSLYAISRTIIELFRGDKRGFLIEGFLSHSQGIAILLLIISIFAYFKLTNNKLTVK